MIQNKIEKQIMWGDLDSLGIVFYPKFYEWLDGCSHLFFEKISLNWVVLSKDHRIGFGLRKTSCEYFSPGRYHQRIIIRTQIEDIEKKMITMKHVVTNKSDDRLMARGFEKRVCLDLKDPENFKAVNIPDDIKKILKNAL